MLMIVSNLNLDVSMQYIIITSFKKCFGKYISANCYQNTPPGGYGFMELDLYGGVQLALEKVTLGMTKSVKKIHLIHDNTFSIISLKYDLKLLIF